VKTRTVDRLVPNAQAPLPSLSLWTPPASRRLPPHSSSVRDSTTAPRRRSPSWHANPIPGGQVGISFIWMLLSIRTKPFPDRTPSGNLLIYDTTFVDAKGKQIPVSYSLCFINRNDTTLQTRSTLAKHTNVEQNKPNNNQVVKWFLVSVNGIVVKMCVELIHSSNNTRRFIAIVIHFHITTPHGITIIL